MAVTSNRALDIKSVDESLTCDHSNESIQCIPFVSHIIPKNKIRKLSNFYLSTLRRKIARSVSLMDAKESRRFVWRDAANRQSTRGLRCVPWEICSAWSLGMSVCCEHFTPSLIMLFWEGPKWCVFNSSMSSTRPNPWRVCTCCRS